MYMTNSKRPTLVEHHLVTEIWEVKNQPPDIAKTVRQRSRKMALPREKVEEDILRRSLGAFPDQDVAAAEKIA